MTDLTPLIERLEKAEAGSRELDRAVYAICDKYMHAQKVTTSLDAAIALVERVLPGWEWNVGYAYVFDSHETPMRSGVARLFKRNERWHLTPDEIFECDDRMEGRTPALALCIALLKALQNKESAG